MSALNERDKHLLFVSISETTVIGHLRRGARIEQHLGKSINDVLLAVSSDRYRLASQFLLSARKALKANPPQYRSAISRAYYAMYHSARAVVYVENRGDDYQDHSKLSQYIPDDFPGVDIWRNKLRAARLLRNRCDYDPYPKQQKLFAEECQDLLSHTNSFLQLSKQYLIGRGCGL